MLFRFKICFRYSSTKLNLFSIFLQYGKLLVFLLPFIWDWFCLRCFRQNNTLGKTAIRFYFGVNSFVHLCNVYIQNTVFSDNLYNYSLGSHIDTIRSNIRTLLYGAVEKRLMTHREIGCFLSGINTVQF